MLEAAPTGMTARAAFAPASSCGFILSGMLLLAPSGTATSGTATGTSTSGTTTGASSAGTAPIASSGGLAERYAAALYSFAEDNRALDQVVAEMEQLGRLIDASADFRRLLESPLIDVQQAREAAFAVLASEGFGKPVRDFVGVIASNRRLRNLRQIVAAFAALVAQKRGVVTAHVASAHALNDVQRQQLRARLIEAGYGNVNIIEQVEPDLLGGLVVRVGARLYDTSLKSRLQRLQYAMKGAA
jgi:F-type H+-transporting ATPase subunit delta